MQMEPVQAGFRVESNLEVFPGHSSSLHIHNLPSQKIKLIQERQMAAVQLQDSIHHMYIDAIVILTLLLTWNMLGILANGSTR